jgi:formiminotetrahydrofolate cyclodeaminase
VSKEIVFSEQTLLDWLFKALVGILGWLGVSLHSRVRDLENLKVSKEDFKQEQERTAAIYSEIKETMKEHREETRQSFSELRQLLLGKKNDHIG